jgi:hypothetical protein
LTVRVCALCLTNAAGRRRLRLVGEGPARTSRGTPRPSTWPRRRRSLAAVVLALIRGQPGKRRARARKAGIPTYLGGPRPHFRPVRAPASATSMRHRRSFRRLGAVAAVGHRAAPAPSLGPPRTATSTGTSLTVSRGKSSELLRIVRAVESLRDSTVEHVPRLGLRKSGSDLHVCEPPVGIEPTTCALRGCRATAPSALPALTPHLSALKALTDLGEHAPSCQWSCQTCRSANGT